MANPLGTRLICALVGVVPLRVILTNWFQRVVLGTYYRYYCPGDGRRARDCVRGGDCGCNNRDRFPAPEREETK